MTWRRLFSPCWLGHGESLRDFQRKADGTIAQPRMLVRRCSICQADLGVILPGQSFKARKIRKPKAKRQATLAKVWPLRVGER